MRRGLGSTTTGAAAPGHCQEPNRPWAAIRCHAWQVYLAAGLAAIAVYFLLPALVERVAAGRANIDRVQAVWYDLFGVCAVMAIVTGVRWYRPVRALPWYVVAAGLGMAVVGDVIINSYAEPPFPSPADPFFILGALAVVAGLVLVIRARVPGGDTSSLIDAGIVATGAGVLAWVFVMAPYAGDNSLTLLQRLVSMAYPLVDVVMLAVAARLIFAPGARTVTFRLVALALVANLTADMIYTEITLNSVYQPGDPVDGVWLLWYVFWGAAALHPSMARLTEPGTAEQARLTMRRLVLLAIAALLVPAARVLQWFLNPGAADFPITSVGSSVIFLLVLVRMSGLMRAVESSRQKLERAVTREHTLREAAAALVAAPSREGIYAAALNAAGELSKQPGSQARVAISAGGELSVVASGGQSARPSASNGKTIDLGLLPAAAYAAIIDLRSASVTRPEAAAFWEALGLDLEARTALITPLVVQHELRGVIVVAGAAEPAEDVGGGLEALASQVALALESAALAEDLHERKSTERFHSLVRNASDVILITEADGTIRYVSPSVERVLGYRPEALLGVSVFAWVHPDDIGLMRSFHAEVITATGASRPVEYRLQHADGEWHHVEAIGTNLLDDPSVRGIVLNARDVTERKLAQDQLVYQAFHDPLTNLPNRILFMDRLDHALDRSTRRGETTAVLFLDLDRFKVVNDSLGHETGDQLLIAIAERLGSCLRPGDTAARLGGDEFTVLLEEVADHGEAIRVAEAVAAAFEPAITLGNRSVFVTASIGIALSRPGQRSADLLRAADIAMYQAKAKGKASYALFDTEMGSAAFRRLELETELRRAIEWEQLRVEFQPEVNLRTGRTVAMEVLVRWDHPERGAVPPTEFVALAEETGLILPLGRWVMRQACQQARIWQELYPKFEAAVGVNLSVKQFQHPTIVEEVARVLAETGLPPHCLTLELTETVVMADAESNSATLQRLKDLGVKLAIDDFGSGYSSLGYLKRFPVDVLKIDRAFVAGLGQDPEDTAIVEAVISLAHNLGMVVTAEGVETAAQCQRLRLLGCDLGQGYYFARPRSAAEASALIERQPWAVAADAVLAAP